MSRILIYNASQLVTPVGNKAAKGQEMSELKIIQDGALYIEDQLIKAVGTTEEVLIETEGLSIDIGIDATGRTILPGFVDAHTHFVFAGDRSGEYAMRLQGKSYMEIHEQGGGIGSTVMATREADFEELVRLALKRLDTMAGFGVTTVEGKSGYGLDLRTELLQLKVIQHLNDTHPLTIVPTFMGAHSLPKEFKHDGDAYVKVVIEEMLPEVIKHKLAFFCDVFCEKGVFTLEQSRRILSAAKEMGLGLKIHADEVVDLGGASLAAELHCVSADHLLMASEENLLKMKVNEVIAVLLPITAFSLNEPYADAKWMLKQHLAIALATDFNPGSSFSESIPLLMALAVRQMGMPPEAVITALTLNGAAALNRAQSIGSLEAGKIADVVIHDCPSYLHLMYHLGVNHVNTVIKEGRIIIKEGVKQEWTE